MGYNYLTKIDYSASGDTFYTGMVTAEANFLSIDNEIYNARKGEATLLAKMDAIDAAQSSGSGVLVSSNDTGGVGYLNGKLIVGEGIDFTENNDAGAETMTIACEDASATNKGILETATDTEAKAFTETDKAIVPSNLAAMDATSTQKGVAKFNTANFLVTSGDVAIKTGGVDLTDEVANTLPIGNGGTGQTTKTPAFDALAPTTTKGDVIASNGSDNLRLAIGTNDKVLTAASGEATGVKWGTGPTTTKGDLPVHNGTLNVRLPVGTNTNVLSCASGQTTGLKWVPAAAEVTPGLSLTPRYSYSTTTAITIPASVHHHQGTVEQLVYWDSLLTFTFGSGGSNADSDNLAASKWFLLFLDDSAVVTQGTALLDAGCFLGKNQDNVTVAWNEAKHGWYEATATSDKCIGAVLTNGASQIIEFINADDGNMVFWADRVENQAAVDIDDAWTDIGALIIPPFATYGLVTFTHSAATGTVFNWRTNGQTGATGHVAAPSQSRIAGSLLVITDSSQIIELISGLSDASTIICMTEGWKFPAGM